MSEQHARPVITHAPATTSPVIMSWVGQLLDPFIQELVERYPEQQVEIVLRASNGKVQSNPRITFNAGPQKMIEAGS